MDSERTLLIAFDEPEGSIHLDLTPYSSASRLVTQASPFGVERCEAHLLSATTNET